MSWATSSGTLSSNLWSVRQVRHARWIDLERMRANSDEVVIEDRLGARFKILAYSRSLVLVLISPGFALTSGVCEAVDHIELLDMRSITFHSVDDGFQLEFGLEIDQNHILVEGGQSRVSPGSILDE